MIFSHTLRPMGHIPAASVLLVGLVAPLWAEDGLGVIEVTAARIGAQDPQSLPLAISVSDAQEIREAHITNLESLAAGVPGMAVSSLNQGQSTPYIRGIGSNEDGAGGDPSVGVFLDEVYLGRSAAWAADLFDLQRIEVLRGPQGTLYGRNVVGGAVNLVTRKPDAQRLRTLDLDYGSLGYRRVGFALSGPVGEREFYASLSGMLKQRDGYLESRTTGERYLDQNRKGVRGRVQFYPGDNTQINVSADYAEMDESGPNRHKTGEFSERVIAPLDPRAARDLHYTYDIDPGRSLGDFWGLSARIDHDLEVLTLTSISAFRRSQLMVDDASLFDNEAYFTSPGFVPYDTTITHGHNRYDEQAQQFSQELRLGGQRGRLEWLVGAYYLRERVFREEDFDLDVTLAPGVIYDGGTGTTDQHNITHSQALFTNLGYALDERWRLLAGARWSRDHKSAHQQGSAGGFLVIEDYDVRAQRRWERFTPKLGLELKASEQLLAYASYSQGYKSGGFQGQAPTALAAANGFAPELADSYEAGVKWHSQNRRMRFNLAAFHTDYQNLQVLELFSPAAAPAGDLGVLLTLNAANARSRGIELEWAAIPAPGWQISGHYAWLDARYSEFHVSDDLGFRFTNAIDRSGNRLRNAPEHSLGLTLRYHHQFTSGTLKARLDWRYYSKNYQDPANLEFAAIPAYQYTDVQLAWQPSDQLELVGWVRNLFDQDYMLQNHPVGTTGLALPAPPRTLGLTLSYRF